MEHFEEENAEETTHTDPQEEVEEVLLTVTEDIRSYIYETARWTRFLSIIGFVATGIMILFSFSAEALISAMNGKVGAANNPWAALGGGFLTIVFLLSALLYFYPSLLLFKYASSAKQAVLYGDQPALSEAMIRMKSFFKFWGIITITVLALYTISFLLAIVAYLGSGSVAP